MTRMSILVAAFALALQLGGMVFFAAVVAPLVFTRLPPEHAGGFIRAVFPFYYLYLIGTSVLAAVPLAFADAYAAGAMAVSAAVTVWLRQGLMPRINALSDAGRAGNTGAKRRFDRSHRLSVIINMVQLIAAAWCLARLV